MKVGDKLTIHCYKHNGKIDRIEKYYGNQFTTNYSL